MILRTVGVLCTVMSTTRGSGRFATLRQAQGKLARRVMGRAKA